MSKKKAAFCLREKSEYACFRSKPMAGGHRVYMEMPDAPKAKGPPARYAKMLSKHEVCFIDLDFESVDGRKPPKGFLAITMSWCGGQYRRQGLGKLLYKGALQEAKRLGYTGLASTQSERNLASDKLWKKLPSSTINNWDTLS